MRAILSTLLAGASLALAGPQAALFFDPTLPIHASPADVGEVLARGLLLKAGPGEWVVYDADLLRPAAWFVSDENREPLSLEGMAQASWRVPTQKGGTKWPQPQGAMVNLVGGLPGVGKTAQDVLSDPRPVFGDDAGRGGLEASGRKFLGYRIAGDTVVLSTECDGVQIQEWFVASRDGANAAVARHLQVAPGKALVFQVAAGTFQLADAKAQHATSGSLSVTSNQPALRLEARDGALLAQLAASNMERRLTLTYVTGTVPLPIATPQVPVADATRWSRTFTTSVQVSTKTGPGWELDAIPLPLDNPWGRRVRPVDLVFLNPQRAAVVTFEGDVWMVDIHEAKCTWRRVAGGMSEPMSIAMVNGTLQVFTRHGLIRLHDANGDGEFETYENFCSLMKQTASTRGYPLDMRVNAAGETFCSIGGIVTSPKGIQGAKAPANPDAGALMKVSADGKRIETISRSAREPFFDLDPATGRIAMSEQQGNYVPSSGIFPVVPGANFGYGDAEPKHLTQPAAWIPHEEDNSSASPLWLRKSAFTEWEGGILDLSYGSGRLYLVRPENSWPATQGVTIPLGIDTGLPLLHGHVHPVDGSLWFAAFRIYDSSAPALEGIGRLRRTADPLASAVSGEVVRDGVVLTFATPLDPASVKPEAVIAKEWQYKRSATYGSPRMKRDGSTGTDGVATGATVLSMDLKHVFIHIPNLKPTMQLQIDHAFALQGGKAVPGTVYFTVSSPARNDWSELGFNMPSLNASLAAVREPKSSGVASAAAGKELSTKYGCIACHSVDGAMVGHSGPTWKGLYGGNRSFKDGSSLPKVDDAYLRESILDPAKRIVKGYELGMGSYQGVLTDTDIESVILYIKSLK